MTYHMDSTTTIGSSEAPQTGRLTVREMRAASALCESVSPVLSRVGEKWTLLVIILLGAGPKRFSELRRQIGVVSKRMLTRTLRGLEEDGLVTRTVYPTVPARVDYELTPLGHSLGITMKALAQWVIDNLSALEAARRPKNPLLSIKKPDIDRSSGKSWSRESRAIQL